MNQILLNRPLSLNDEPLDSEHILACSRVPYLEVKSLIDNCNKGKWLAKFIERPFDCCKNLENVDIEAWYSCAKEKEKGTPDIYKIHCKVCEQDFLNGVVRPGRNIPAGYTLVAFCVGGNHPDSKKFTPTQRPDLFDQRPYWEIR